jgi:hypothetical protein
MTKLNFVILIHILVDMLLRYNGNANKGIFTKF